MVFVVEGKSVGSGGSIGEKGSLWNEEEATSIPSRNI
jgi:hypothetical protein